MIHQCLLVAWFMLAVTWFVWETWLRDAAVQEVSADAAGQPHQPAIIHQQADSDDTLMDAATTTTTTVVDCASTPSGHHHHHHCRHQRVACRRCCCCCGAEPETPGSSDSSSTVCAGAQLLELRRQLRRMKSLVETLLPHHAQQLPNASTPSNVTSPNSSPSKPAGAGSMDTSALVERLRTLEREKAALLEENGSQRRRFERCLSDVTNHVIRVLLAQKSVRSECLQLQQRVEQLERQNHQLQLLVQQTFSSLTYSTLQALNQAASLCTRDGQELGQNTACKAAPTSGMQNSITSESSTVAASASADYRNSSSASDGGRSSSASTARASTTSYLGTSVNSNGSGWFRHSSQQIKSPSSLPDGYTSDRSTLALLSHPAQCKRCQQPTFGLHDCDEVDVCQNCLMRDRCSGGGGYIRNSDLDDVSDLVCSAGTSSPTANLLSLNDLFCRKFAVDNQHKSRMVLVHPRGTAEVDSESDDMTSAREARSEREGGGASASTLSLNDLLDDDSGSSDLSTPEGCDNLSISDYEQLVVDGCPTALADNSSLLPPPPLSLLHNGYSPSTEAKYVFIPVEEDERNVDSSTDSSDYTNLADDETMVSALRNPVTSCVASSGQNVLSAVPGKLCNGSDRNSVRTSQQSDIILPEKTRVCLSNSHMLVSGPNGIHRPTVLLTRRRKRASLAASAIVHSIQQNGDNPFMNLSSHGLPFLKSSGCGARTVVLYKDFPEGNGTGSSDECPSLESLDQPGFRSSDGGDTVVCEKPFSSQDDGYCTAKSNVAVQLACCQHLSKITSSSEVDSSVDGVSLQNLSEVGDSMSISAALPEHFTNSQQEKPTYFDCPIVSRVQLESSQNHLDTLIGVVDSSDLETDVGDGPERYSSQSSLRSLPCQSSLPLGSVMIETCRLPLQSVENSANDVAEYRYDRRHVIHEVDGDVQQAIDMFAFLDDQDSSANAASNTSQ